MPRTRRPASSRRRSPYYQNEADFLLALESGRIDLYFGPAPSASYRHETTGKTQIVGVVPGGGDIPAQIAAMSLKDSGLAAPIAAALNHVIESGAYAEVLAKWGLERRSHRRLRGQPARPAGVLT